MTLMILLLLSVVMLANRKITVPASGLFHITIALLLATTIGVFVGDRASGFTPDNTDVLEAYINIHTAAAVFCYILRPFIILTELLVIVPDVKYRFLLTLPAIINSVIYIAAPFTDGLIFTFGETNSFKRGDLGYTIFFTMLFYVAALVVCSVRRFRTQSRSQNIIVFGMLTVAVSVSIMEAANVGTGYVETVTALSILAYYAYLVTVYQQEMR